jgi:hypothetical protein
MKDGMVRAVTEEEYRKEQCRKALQWLKQEGIENTTVSIPPKRLAMLLVRYTDEVRHASVLSVEQQEVKNDLHYYTIVDDTGRERVMECWHPVGMLKVDREREALKYAEKLFAE